MASRATQYSPEATRTDTFSAAWGATTRWKSGVPRHMRYGLKLEFNPPADVGPRPATMPHVSSAPGLDKPLPLLPHQASAMATSKEADLEAAVNPAEGQPSTFFGSSLIPWLRMKKRLSEIKRRKQKSTTTEGPHVLDVSAPKSYVEKGTQTSPRLLVHEKEQSNKTTRGLRPQRQSDTQDNVPSPVTSETLTPLWSPRKLLVSNGPADYFSLPAATSDLRDSKRSTKPSGSASPKRDSPSPKERPQIIRDETKDSLGTYDSRYSERPAQVISTAEKSAKRRSISDSSIPDAMSSARRSIGHAKPSDDDASLEFQLSNQSTTNKSIRPMPFPYQKLPPFTKSPRNPRPKRSASSSQSSGISPLNPEPSHHRDSHTSSSGKNSPLRQGITAPHKTVDLGRESSDFSSAFDPEDLPHIIPVDVVAASTTDIPDHLKNSPLCPRHPKHKSGGTGFCPIHGKHTDSLGGSSDSDAIVKRPPAENPDTLTNVALPFRLELPYHSSDDPNCPANMQTKGVCLRHGRALQVDSEDSVTRLSVL